MDLLTQHLDNLAQLYHEGSTFGGDSKNKESKWDDTFPSFDRIDEEPTTH